MQKFKKSIVLRTVSMEDSKVLKYIKNTELYIFSINP